MGYKLRFIFEPIFYLSRKRRIIRSVIFPSTRTKFTEIGLEIVKKMDICFELVVLFCCRHAFPTGFRRNSTK